MLFPYTADALRYDEHANEDSFSLKWEFYKLILNKSDYKLSPLKYLESSSAFFDLLVESTQVEWDILLLLNISD